MPLPRFRIQTLTVGIAVGTVLLFEGYVGLAEILMWYGANHRAQIAYDMAAQVEARIGTRGEWPSDHQLLSDCQRAAVAAGQWE